MNCLAISTQLTLLLKTANSSFKVNFCDINLQKRKTCMKHVKIEANKILMTAKKAEHGKNFHVN